MNFYASKIESSYLCAKEEMARLTVTFKKAYDNRSIGNIDTKHPHLMGIVHNPNNIRGLVIVKTKGLRSHGGNRDGLPEDVLVASVRHRICLVCSSFGHNRHNCQATNAIPRSQRGVSSSNNALEQDQGTRTDWTSTNNYFQDCSTHDSLHYSDFMYKINGQNIRPFNPKTNLILGL